jgi:hypothetical protein
MKKYFAMMVAVLFLFGVVGMSFAQQAAPSGKQDTPAAPIDGKKRQAQTPEKKKAAEAPKTGEGMAAPPAAPEKK